MMDEALRRQRLHEMGVQLWQPRGDMAAQLVAADVVSAPAPVEVATAIEPDFGPVSAAESERMAETDNEIPFAGVGEGDGETADTEPTTHGLPALELAVDLAALRAQVSVCMRCELHQSRTNTVFGVGSESARLLVIGEAPGGDEDRQGEPFVGRAGKLLNAMLMAIGLAREQVYIANILKCRPPGNRDPKAGEVACCEHYLRQQIAFVEPQLILAVGRIAAQNLLGVTTPIGKLRGKFYTHKPSGVPLAVTYHPAYLLRSPVEKRRAWEDLKQVASALASEP